MAKSQTDGTEKEKRAPTAYNIFVGENLKKWIAEHPGVPVKEGMSAVRRLPPPHPFLTLAASRSLPFGPDSPDNPKRGQAVVKRAPKAKAPKADKPKAAKKASKSKSKKEAEVEEEDDDEDEKENELQTSDDL
ncbi:hypothetical protein DFH09DRAFT_1148941, partial [Mycena vulgaris]